MFEALFIWLMIAVVTTIIAKSKGRFGLGWFILGLIFSIFALILIACLPSLKPQVVMAGNAAAAPASSDIKACQDCGETVLKVANVCKHCGFRFDGQPRAIRS